LPGGKSKARMQKADQQGEDGATEEKMYRATESSARKE